MRRSIRHNVTLPVLCIGLVCVLASRFIITAHAGLRGPGKYSGVIVFDRWDTCLLLSGHFITYISDGIKNKLRPFKGKAMEIDALEVSQPMNPGDALVRNYRIIGPAPDNHRWVSLDGLELVAKTDFGMEGTATFLIELRNSGNKQVDVNTSEFGPTLLGLNRDLPFSASDGKSAAWITRAGLLNTASWESEKDGVKISVAFILDPKTRLPERFQLAPGESVQVRITFQVPPGQYQFIVGYGGGVHEEKSLASNTVSFDLNDKGVASLARPALHNEPR